MFSELISGITVSALLETIKFDNGFCAASGLSLHDFPMHISFYHLYSLKIMRSLLRNHTASFWF